MDTLSGPNPSLDPPSPRRTRVSKLRTVVGLFGAPAAWVAQLMLSEPVAAYVCYPFQAPLSAPIWKEAPAILATINIVCLAGALLSGFIAWTVWQQTKTTAVPHGELTAGRRLFLAKISLMSSFIFIVAVIFNLFAVLLVPLCSGWF